MRGVIAVLILCTTMLPLGDISAQKQKKKRGPLFGSLVVIDPGHGGEDPGSSRIHKGARVTEDEYTYDVALRVARLVRAREGIAALTIRDNIGVRDLPASEIFPDARTERFALDRTIVKAGQTGLSKRLSYGNQLARKYRNHRRVWISIHFDVVGTRKDVAGVRIIAADKSGHLAKTLTQSFDSSHRLRDENPLVESGDDKFGIRNLFVLGGTNRIGDRVLVELGNFNNDTDLWRIRDPSVRESYALAIVRALEIKK